MKNYNFFLIHDATPTSVGRQMNLFNPDIFLQTQPSIHCRLISLKLKHFQTPLSKLLAVIKYLKYILVLVSIVN